MNFRRDKKNLKDAKHSLRSKILDCETSIFALTFNNQLLALLFYIAQPISLPATEK